MPNIVTKTGSATSPREDGKEGLIIAHICNSVGGWGAGFVLAVSKLSKVPEAAYRALAAEHNGQIPIGTLQFVEAKPRIFVANMVTQEGTDPSKGCLVNYSALKDCLRQTLARAVLLNYHVHMPAGMGSGLAGGDKVTILKLIEQTATQVEEMTTKVSSHSLNIVLWEFEDKSAASYVGGPQDAKPTTDGFDLGLV